MNCYRDSLPNPSCLRAYLHPPELLKCWLRRLVELERVVAQEPGTTELLAETEAYPANENRKLRWLQVPAVLRQLTGIGTPHVQCDFLNPRSIECAMQSQCTHLDQIKLTTTHTHVCEDCVKIGDRWVHLRLCLTCGHVGCCDSSKNKHATRHFREVAHPLIRSIEPGERWTWCYVDQIEGELAR